MRPVEFLVLFLLVVTAPIQIRAEALTNPVGDLVAGAVYPVPMNSATNQGSIDLPNPNGNGEYELILYSLNPYHAHNKITSNPSDYPEGLFNFKVSVDASTSASVSEVPVHLQSITTPGAGGGRMVEMEDSAAPSPAQRSAGETRIFKIDQGRTSINTTLWRISETSYLYVDNRVPQENFNVTDAEHLGQLFDQTVLPREVEVFGSPAPNPDGDNRIVIVFTLPSVVNGDDLDTPNGYNTNHRNILFLYTPDPEGKYADYVKGIPKDQFIKESLPHRIAHALNHLLNFSEHCELRKGPMEYLGIWEGLANLAEYIALGDSGLAESRDCAKYFLREPGVFSVLDRTTGYYGAHTTFVWYLYEIYGIEAIKKLSQTNKVGPDNVEAATGQEFAQIVRDWSAAMFLSNTDLNLDPRYQFKILNIRSIRSRGPLEVSLTVGDQYTGQVRSTGAYYFLLKASPKSGALALRIEGQSDSQLQASVIRLPTDFNILADIPPDAYVVNGILLDSSIPGQLVLGEELSLSGSVNDARAKQVFIGVGPQDGSTFWQNEGPALWQTRAPVENGRFIVHVPLGRPNQWSDKSLQPGDYRLSITYMYDGSWAPEHNFPSIRILSKAPTVETTVTSATTRLERTTTTTTAASSPTTLETGSSTVQSTETVPVPPQNSSVFVGLAIIVPTFIGILYLHRRRK